MVHNKNWAGLISILLIQLGNKRQQRYELVFLTMMASEWRMQPEMQKKWQKKGVVVLGSEYASALANEEKRLSEGTHGVSPLPQLSYANWPDEQHFYDPVWNSLDETIFNQVRIFVTLSPEKRITIRKTLSMDEIYTLLLFSERIAIFALRQNRSDLITEAVNSLTMIEVERCDFRDLLVSLGFVVYAAGKLGINSTVLLKEAAKNADIGTAQLLLDFTKRSKLDRELESLAGYSPVQTIHGVGFVRTNYKKYAPTKLLHKILLNISEMLVADHYTVGKVTIGEEIPGIWLSSYDDTEFKNLINKLNGCASLHSEIKRSCAKDNMLLIYLAEFKNNRNAEDIFILVNERRKKGFSRLMMLSGNLLCIVIGRSYRVGVKTAETDKTLKRFEGPILRLLAETQPY